MCAIAFQTLEQKLLGKQSDNSLIQQLPDVKTKIFVTYHKNNELRGCIGTFSEQKLKQQLPQYAAIAAFQDYRFDPINQDELQDLEVTVSLLVNFEECYCMDWEVGKHGIEIEYKGHHATFLPEVAEEEGWDQKTTLKYLLRKAGVRAPFNEETMGNDIHCIRYQSSICKMTYKEYKQNYN